jgi:peptidoglycan/LPS O-acetylase OafA/YrhL
MKFHENLPINYFDYYFISFTRITDLTGYDGGLTLGPAWFILYLFVVSCIALVIIKLLKNRIDLSKRELSFPILILLGFIPLILTPVLNTFNNTKSIGMFLGLFLLGYYVLSNDKVIEKLEKNKITLGILTLILTIIFIYIAGIVFGLGTIPPNDTIISILFFYQVFYGWICVLFLLVIGKIYLNKTNSILQYLSEASYTIYIFHMPILIAIAFYILQITSNMGMQIILTLILTIPLTIGVCAICNKFKIIRFLFGIK